jgi:hypothetical protein
MFAYSNLNSMAQPAAGDQPAAAPLLGLTYETGDPGCTALSGACPIVYRSIDELY